MALFPISVHCSVGPPLILPMVPLLYLESFVAVSYWKHGFSQMSLVVSVVAVSTFVPFVVALS